MPRLPPKPLPSQKLLRQWFHYDPKTGLFLYRTEINQHRLLAGGHPGMLVREAAWTPRGPYSANRLIWKWWYGTSPDGRVHTRDRRVPHTIADINHNRILTNLYTV